MRFTFRGGEAPPFDGEVLVYDSPRVLAYRWATDVLRWELEADGSGCLLTFTDTIDAQEVHPGYVSRLGPEAATIGPPASMAPTAGPPA